MPDIRQAKILVLATDGFEQSELLVPVEQLRAKGATVHVVAPEITTPSYCPAVRSTRTSCAARSRRSR
jgi:putative intracellular protease/amidase